MPRKNIKDKIKESLEEEEDQVSDMDKIELDNEEKPEKEIEEEQEVKEQEEPEEQEQSQEQAEEQEPIEEESETKEEEVPSEEPEHQEPPAQEEPKYMEPVLLASYSFSSEGIPVDVKIMKKDDFVPTYEITIPGIDEWTKKMLEKSLKAELVAEVNLDISEILDPKKFNDVKKKFLSTGKSILKREFPNLSDANIGILAVYLLQNTLGLGELENLRSDDELEEIAINSSKENVWIYHKKFGWCRTNLIVKEESVTYDYASMVARKIGRQINVLTPMLDAHLPNGDRVNATLSPVSHFGNTITIRKFARNPWTITNFIKSRTVSSELSALIWLCIQNELSLVVSGGTGSGKTSFLNALAGLIPANQRIVSIEDTRELTLPSFLHWVPMVVREANPEGKGEVKMLDLMVNALRQRPDRILVGEVRRREEAEILFEAMHTGHSVYATLHADNSEQTISRLTNPPIDLPEAMLDALAGIVVQFRHRRFNIRRTLEFSEVMKGGKLNPVYRWDIKSDKIKAIAKLLRLHELLSLYAGMSEKEISSDVEEKKDVLDWMVKHGHEEVDDVGRIISHYYMDPDEVLKYVKKDQPWVFNR